MKDDAGFPVCIHAFVCVCVSSSRAVCVILALPSCSLYLCLCVGAMLWAVHPRHMLLIPIVCASRLQALLPLSLSRTRYAYTSVYAYTTRDMCACVTEMRDGTSGRQMRGANEGNPTHVLSLSLSPCFLASTVCLTIAYPCCVTCC